MCGCVDVKTVLRIAKSNQKPFIILCPVEEKICYLEKSAHHSSVDSALSILWQSCCVDEPKVCAKQPKNEKTRLVKTSFKVVFKVHLDPRLATKLASLKWAS
jgi:hypothetical protein